MNNPDRFKWKASITILALGLIVMTACGKRKSDEHPPRQAEAASGSKPLVLSDSQIAMQKITFGPTAPAALKRFLTVSGEIALNAEREVRITPRFAGVVKEVRTSPGDHVAKGQILAVSRATKA